MASPATYGTGVHPKANQAARVSAKRRDPPTAKVEFYECSLASPAIYKTGVHTKANEAVRISATRSDRTPKPKETNGVPKCDEETHI